MVSQARVNVPLCVQGDSPKLMILDMPRDRVGSVGAVPARSRMQALAESLDDFNNPFFGLSRSQFNDFIVDMKNSDADRCAAVCSDGLSPHAGRGFDVSSSYRSSGSDSVLQTECSSDNSLVSR